MRANRGKTKQNNDNEEIRTNIGNNKIIDNENQKNIDLSSPVPNFPYQRKPQNQVLNQNKIKNKNKLYEMFEVEYEKNMYSLFFYMNDNNNLVIEFISRDGYLPYSYKNIFDEKMFYNINKIFMELRTIDRIGEKIINLYKKNKVIFSKNKKEDIFYLILKITIIDEDTDIFIPLNKNENIQICTINYLLKETDKLKNDFSDYKNETEDIIKQQMDEIKGLKKTNSLYLKIIKKIREEYEKKNVKKKIKKIDESFSDEEEENEKEDNNNNKIIIHIKEKYNNKNNNDENNEDDVLNKVNDIIIDENEQYKIIKNKIETMEKELKNITKNYRCDINSKYYVLNLTINQSKPFLLINFELENTGVYSLTSKLDDIFCNIEGINQEFISFYNESERYISLHEPLLPNKKIIVSKKLVLNNPVVKRKYYFYLNIYTLNHGRISEQPIKFQIYIRGNGEQENFIKFLQNKKWAFGNKNKNKNRKIILEYAQYMKHNNEYNFALFNKNNINEFDYEIKEGDIKIRKYIYDENTGMAYENRDGEIVNNNDKFFRQLVVNIAINRDDVNKIVKKIYNKYEESKKLDRIKIEEVICSCIGDFKKICKLIEKMI